jgi:hypothetical protein
MIPHYICNTASSPSQHQQLGTLLASAASSTSQNSLTFALSSAPPRENGSACCRVLSFGNYILYSLTVIIRSLCNVLFATNQGREPEDRREVASSE